MHQHRFDPPLLIARFLEKIYYIHEETTELENHEQDVVNSDTSS
jgi:hypothetical protein